MSVKKLPSGRWQGRFKIGRIQVASRVFQTKREAEAWVERQRAAYRDGYDPRAGKVRIGDVLDEWLEMRKSKVSATTYATDRQLLVPEVLPDWAKNINANSFTPKHAERCQDGLIARGLTATSVRRYRSSLSPFFSWCVREQYVPANPFTSVDLPKDRRPSTGIRPFNSGELSEVVREVAKHHAEYSMLIHVLGWTGLRWSEARAMRVCDFVQVPTPLLLVGRAQPEGAPLKTTKSGKARRVPIADAVLPLVREFASGKEAHALLFTTAEGTQLHRTSFVRKARWATLGRGRTIHDLRHTAACEWIGRGVPLPTVQAWLGHSSYSVTQRYLHHLGDYADRSALELLNGGRGVVGVSEFGEEEVG